ncbi:MAG: D-alanyl-D-alanine carboxypeptidase/D-alanyl-D-alanine-endopeptidase [Bacteroidetes bacterium]|nr:D-alanyl-D-alanine carboxypeptidase/D-alanyl-D-alanine-endopeptidase [Bacteroidota bacterium]MBS1755890.1 D-alanyl-D-alanine carboxypeptidase/D-alanyl-D-alanine-endopeptidase [Bacteroidota bacterium]
MKILLLFICLPFAGPAFSQSVSKKLSDAIESLQKDSQFLHAGISIFVTDAHTGEAVFQKNAETGMAPASCQKIITSAAAFELLGKNFNYKTYMAVNGEIKNNILRGDLVFMGAGDPTLGSWRWKQTMQEVILKKINTVIKKNNITAIDGDLVVYNPYFGYNPVPDGWIWQDIGNYYGAGAWGLNWNENQYDVKLKSTQLINDSTEIVATVPSNFKNSIINFVTSAKKGSGDNVYLYAAPYSNNIFARGTIPVGENEFKVSGSMPNPSLAFAKNVAAQFDDNAIKYSGNIVTDFTMDGNKTAQLKILDSLVSPGFDSMNYWFLKKSINLYGEAFVKTIAIKNNSAGATDSGIAIIRNFWSTKGIDKSSIKIIDGSGLSPANRVTTKALVAVLLYAQKQPWFSSFYFDLPLINNIKMKDGYINGVRSYSGYIKSSNGKEYCFSFIVNNFDGNPGTVKDKMWKLLDLLK